MNTTLKNKLSNFGLVFVLTLFTFNSCSKDEPEFNTRDHNHSEPIAIEKTVENGRFFFSSKESLKATIDDFQNDAIENVEKEFEQLYEKGFRSHKPIVSPENEYLQAKLSQEIMLRRQLRKSSTNSLSRTSGTEDEEETEAGDVPSTQTDDAAAVKED